MGVTYLTVGPKPECPLCRDGVYRFRHGDVYYHDGLPEPAPMFVCSEKPGDDPEISRLADDGCPHA